MQKDLNDLKKVYSSIQIPNELDDIASKAALQGIKKIQKRTLFWKVMTLVSTTSCILLTCLFIYTYNENRLNESMKDSVVAPMPSVAKSNQIIADPLVNVMEFNQYITVQSVTNANENKYIIVDTAENRIIKLEDLFISDEYIKLISSYIKTEIQNQENNKNGIKYYNDEKKFNGITSDTPFYISEQGQIVFVFRKGEIAEQNVGEIRFAIPSEIIKPILKENTL